MFFCQVFPFVVLSNNAFVTDSSIPEFSNPSKDVRLFWQRSNSFNVHTILSCATQAKGQNMAEKSVYEGTCATRQVAALSNDVCDEFPRWHSGEFLRRQSLHISTNMFVELYWSRSIHGFFGQISMAQTWFGCPNTELFPLLNIFFFWTRYEAPSCSWKNSVSRCGQLARINQI